MKNSRSSAKSRVAVGKFLRARRHTLDLTMAEVAMKAGTLSLNQVAIHKIERGVKGVRISDIRPLSRAYALEVEELLTQTGYSHEEYAENLKHTPPESEFDLLKGINPGKPVTIEDLKFLITILEGLFSPLSLGEVIQLLNRRP